MSEVTVYQVRSVNIYGDQNIVHAYESEEQAKAAIETMRSRTKKRYIIVPVPNAPDQHWGINFPVQPEPEKQKTKRR